jgi:hypothetical protein
MQNILKEEINILFLLVLSTKMEIEQLNELIIQEKIEEE